MTRKNLYGQSVMGLAGASAPFVDPKRSFCSSSGILNMAQACSALFWIYIYESPLGRRKCGFERTRLERSCRNAS